MANTFKRLLTLVLAIVMCVSIALPTFAEEATTEEEIVISNLIDKVSSGLDGNDQTNVTLTVPGEKIDLSSDIVFIIGNGPAYNYDYIVEMVHKMLVAVDGTPTKIKIGMVGFADTTEDEAVLGLTEMVDTVPGNKVADYRIEGRYNDGKQYTEALEDYQARKAAAQAAWEAENPALVGDMEYVIAKALERAEDVYSGINLESSLITARDMLVADEEVPANRKHMIVVSTGLTYWFDNDAGEPVTVVGTNVVGNIMHGNKYWLQARDGSTNTSAGYYLKGWMVVNGEDGKPDYQKSWNRYWNMIEGWIEADQNAYVYNPHKTYTEFFYNGNSTEIKPNNNTNYRYGYAIQNAEDLANVTGAVPYFAGGSNPATTPNAAHALNYERAQYEAWVVYKQMETAIGESFETVLKDKEGNNIVVEGLGFNCYSVANGVSSNPGEEDRWLASNQIGYNFMHMLGGENTVNYRDGDTSFFDSIENKILYTCADGSKVTDYIGMNENGNFEFIQDAANITVVYGGKTYQATQIATKEGATASYTFGDEKVSFELDYFYGDGKITERLEWVFHEDVSMENKAALTYKLQLTDKLDEENIYMVPTNLVAYLDPIDSKGQEGERQYFPVPVEEYEVYYPVHTPGSLTVIKTTTGAETPATALFQLEMLNGETWEAVGEAVPYSAFENGSYTFADLEAGTYRVVETDAEVEDNTLETTYGENAVLTQTEAENGDTTVSNGEFTVENEYTVIIEEEEPPLEDIPDDDVPMGDLPKTGDASIVGLCMVLTALSGTGLGMTFKKRKDQE